MVELKDVVYELVDQTSTGALQWQVNELNQTWRARRSDCDYTVAKTSHEDWELKIAWPFYPGETNVKPLVSIGSGASIKPLTDLLQAKFPFAPPCRPTEDNALRAALESLKEHR